MFSQWFGAPFEHDGQCYPAAEHWMMAGKARLFGDDATLALNLAARSPGEAKALSRRVRGFDEDVWNAHRMSIVVEGSVHQFTNDPSFATTSGPLHSECSWKQACSIAFGASVLPPTIPTQRDPTSGRG